MKCTEHDNLNRDYFKGGISKIDFRCLVDLIARSSQVRFNLPETTNRDYDFIIDLIGKTRFVDLAFDSVPLNMVSRVFVNLISNDEGIELLFFFDLKDVECGTKRDAVDIMIAWAKEFREAYKFDTFICQVDNANDDQFYFKDDEYGPQYGKLV